MPKAKTSSLNATPHERARFAQLVEDLVADQEKKGVPAARSKVAALLGMTPEHMGRVQKAAGDKNYRELSRDKLALAAGNVGFSTEYFAAATGSFRDFAPRQPDRPALGGATSLHQVVHMAIDLLMLTDDIAALDGRADAMAQAVLSLDLLRLAQSVEAARTAEDRRELALSLAMRIRTSADKIAKSHGKETDA